MQPNDPNQMPQQQQAPQAYPQQPHPQQYAPQQYAPMPYPPPPQEAEKDPRVVGTGIIAGIALGGLGICIPIVATAGGGLTLPLALIAGCSVAVASVWKFAKSSNNETATPTADVQRLETRIKELEDRLDTALMLDNFEDRLAEKEAARRLGPESASPNSQPTSENPQSSGSAPGKVAN